MNPLVLLVGLAGPAQADTGLHYTCPEMWGYVPWMARFVELRGSSRTHLGLEPGPGALTTDVPEGREDVMGGLGNGDIVLSVAGQPVGDAWDMRRLAREHAGQTVTLKILRVREGWSSGSKGNPLEQRKLKVDLEPAKDDPTFSPEGYQACLDELQDQPLEIRIAALTQLRTALPKDQLADNGRRLQELRAQTSGQSDTCVACHPPLRH